MDLRRLARRLRPKGSGTVCGSDLPDDLRPAYPLDAPGPVAGWDWTVENLDYALKDVPKEKLSLGIPLYGYHWFAGAPIVEGTGAEKQEKSNITAEYISTPDALLLASEYKGTPEWDAADHSAWFFVYRDQMREWVFYTDIRTFEDRYKLVQQRGLEGFCSWVLGRKTRGSGSCCRSGNS